MARSAVVVRAGSRLAPTVEALDHAFEVSRDKAAPFLDLAIRFWLAQIFFTSGSVKAATWEATVWLYTYEHPVPGISPATAALLGTGFELVCSILLAVGLMTRLAAIPLLLTAAFLQFTYKELNIHVYWMILLALFVIRGPGPLSLDHLIAPHLAGSALPLGGALRKLGATLERHLTPFYGFFIRVWLAYVIASPQFALVVSKPLAIDDVVSASFTIAFSALLAAGLLTRPAALALIVLAAARLFGVPDRDEQLLQMFLLGTLALEGAGPSAIDRRLQEMFHRLFPSLSGDPAWLEGAPRVVIVGAGFGGVAAAVKLRHAWARVTLVDRRNYHLFQPLLYQVATAMLSPADIATPVRALLRRQINCQVIMGRVTDVDTDSKRVLVGERRIPYDYLILATGARHSYFGKDEWEPFAPGLKKVDDATAVRARILTAFERAETCTDVDERQRLLTFVVVGGGPTGVELAGAIAELAHHGMQGEFRAVDPTTARVVLVQSGPRVLPAMPERLSSKALRSLQSLGVDVLLNSRVEHVDAEGVLVNGQRIEARTVLWAAGVIASPAGRWIGARRDKAGRVIVSGDLSVPGCDHVFAIGDTAACLDGNGQTVPGLAAVAKQQGWHVAKIIRAQIERRPAPGSFHYRDYGTMATIGRKAAVAALLGIRVSGATAWWLWGIVHVTFLVGARSRVAVMLNWFWSYLTYNRSMRLITGAGSGAD